MLDVRALANFILDEADRRGLALSNMAINKVVYFLHADHLVEEGKSLVSAKIEAWQHGPVFRELYHQFKGFGDQPISGRATQVDPYSGETIMAKLSFSPEEEKKVLELLNRYISYSAAQLRALSHIDGGPWHVVWGHDGRSNPGMKISNDLILRHYSPGVKQ